MTHFITSLCVRDRGCIDVCPVECMIPGNPVNEFPWIYIDPDTCIDCGACVPECPFAAIFPEDEVPAAYTAKGGEYISNVGLTGHYEATNHHGKPVVLDTVRQLAAGEVVDLTPDIQPNYDLFKSGPGCEGDGHQGPGGREGTPGTTGVPTGLAVALPGWIPDLVNPGHRFSADEEKMGLAIRLAAENVEREVGGGPFGAAVFQRDTGRLVSVGVNSVIRLGNSILHAEVVALMLAHRATGFYSFAAPGAPSLELVTSCEPCIMCLGATHWSGVSRLVCGATKSDAEALGFDEGPVDARLAVWVDALVGQLRPDRFLPPHEHWIEPRGALAVCRVDGLLSRALAGGHGAKLAEVKGLQLVVCRLNLRSDRD